MTVADPLSEFRDVLADQGFRCTEVVADGAVHRVAVEGDRAGQRSGWYVLHDDGIAAGAYGDWRNGSSNRWRQSGVTIDPAERARSQAAYRETKRQRIESRDREQRASQVRAQRLWAEAAQPDPHHPYLFAKRVKAHGIRQHDDDLLIPLRNVERELWAVQFIAPDGSKRFLRGARKAGLFHLIGESVGDVVLVAEGYATGATLHETTGHPAVVAFDAGNLTPVAIALRAAYPTTHIVVAADDDRATEERIGRNPGKHYAEQAARAVGGVVALPEFDR